MAPLILGLIFTPPVFASGPPLPWPGQNPPGYSGPPPPETVGPAQSLPAPPPPQAPAPVFQSPNQPDQATQAIQQMLNQMMGGKNGKGRLFEDEAGGADLRDGMSSSYGFKVQTPTDGKMEPCQNVPQVVQAAYQEAIEFRKFCEYAQKRGEGQRLVINDFSSKSRSDTPYMYIFSLDGKCLGKTAVTYGNGLGPVVPEPCSDEGRHLTPPGFHLTGYHDSSLFPDGTSLGLISLEGQGSNGRGILIHPAGSPGTASSFGCAGVGSFDTVKRTLGEGALVYNFFGDKGKARGCRSSKGLDHSSPCRLEAPSAVHSDAAGTGTPAISGSSSTNK